MPVYNTISFDLPEGWLDRSSIQLVEARPVVRAPASIAIESMEVEEGYSLEQLGEAMAEGVRQTEGCELLDARLTEIAGRPAHRLEFRMSTGEGPAMHRIQTAVQTDGDYVILTCTGPEEGFDVHGPIFDRAVASFNVGAA